MDISSYINHGFISTKSENDWLVLYTTMQLQVEIRVEAGSLYIISASMVNHKDYLSRLFGLYCHCVSDGQNNRVHVNADGCVQGPPPIQRCRVDGIGIPVIKIRRSHRLIFKMLFPIHEKTAYIEMDPYLRY